MRNLFDLSGTSS